MEQPFSLETAGPEICASGKPGMERPACYGFRAEQRPTLSWVRQKKGVRGWREERRRKGRKERMKEGEGKRRGGREKEGRSRQPEK